MLRSHGAKVAVKVKNARVTFIITDVEITNDHKNTDQFIDEKQLSSKF